jgi:radical SAM superfamily enzyme YgiQ (UPF0313 family)
MLDLAVRAGLTQIEFGTDTFCDSVLEQYGKQFTFETSCILVSFVPRERILLPLPYYGVPGETEKTVDTSIENSKKLSPASSLRTLVFAIYPNTPLYKRAIAEGIIDETTSLLDPVFYLAKSFDEPAIARKLQQHALTHPKLGRWQAASRFRCTRPKTPKKRNNWAFVELF